MHQNGHLVIYEESNYSLAIYVHLTSGTGFRALLWTLYLPHKFGIIV